MSIKVFPILSEKISRNHQISDKMNSFDADVDGIDGKSGLENGNRTESPVRLDYVVVIGEEKNSTPIELPLTDGFLSLSTLHIEFPQSNGIKYMNPTTGLYRVIAPDAAGRLAAPPIGWKNSQFLVCNSAKFPIASLKRQLTSPEILPSKFLLGDPTERHLSSPGCSSDFATLGRPANPTYGSGGSRLAPFNQGSYGYNSNPPTSGAFPPGPTKVFDHCSICNVDLNAASQAEMHYRGKKHLEALSMGGPLPPSLAARGRARGISSTAPFSRGTGRGLPPTRGTGVGRGQPNPNSRQFDFTDDNVSSGMEFSNYTYK